MDILIVEDRPFPCRRTVVKQCSASQSCDFLRRAFSRFMSSCEARNSNTSYNELQVVACSSFPGISRATYATLGDLDSIFLDHRICVSFPSWFPSPWFSQSRALAPITPLCCCWLSSSRSSFVEPSLAAHTRSTHLAIPPPSPPSPPDRPTPRSPRLPPLSLPWCFFSRTVASCVASFPS